MAFLDQHEYIRSATAGIFTLVLLVGSIPGFTRAITTIQFYRSRSSRTAPPTVPYWIPWFGNLFQFMFNQVQFWEDVVSVCPRVRRIAEVAL